MAALLAYVCAAGVFYFALRNELPFALLCLIAGACIALRGMLSERGKG